MTNLGVYYAPEHRIPDDADYIRKLQPPVIRLLDPDVQQIADMHALAPGAVICPRTWVIDDNNGAAVHNLMADPIKTGIDHANQYRGQLDRWKQEAHDRGLSLPADNEIYFNAANEPNQGGTPDKIAAYTVAFLNRCYELGIQATALCLGVGWPDNIGPGTKVNWAPYTAIVEPIKRGHHWLELHEYFYDDGPQNNWTWWAGRHLQCPFDVPILLAEIGIDNYVDHARWEHEGGNRGWQGNVTPDQYGDMIQWHINHSDKRVIAALPFLTDFRNREWESFNTRGAHGAFLARKDAMVTQASPSTSTPIPPTTTTMYVSVPSGARIRSAPVIRTDNILGAVAYGEPVYVTSSYTNDHQWVKVGHQDIRGWMNSALLSSVKPPLIPTTPPLPPGSEKWQRSITFVMSWEGGYVDNPADPGGATNMGITMNTYTRWCQEHGKPVPTKDDLRNLTTAEAKTIYFEWYWLPSHSDQLAWPLCLANFDTAVNAGVGRSEEMLLKSGDNFNAYMGHVIDWYTRIAGFDTFGKAWIRRRADLLLEASK